MKSFCKIILSIFIFYTGVQTVTAIDETPQVIKKGTLVKVISREEINTLSADKEDKFPFINLQDMYIYETNAIPESTVFYGVIEDIKEPVSGKDGALKIVVDKMITPNKKIYEINAHIYGSNEGYIGGRQTSSAYYHKIYNHSKGFKPFLQVVPLNVYDMGKHTIIKPGAEFFVVFDEDVELK